MADRTATTRCLLSVDEFDAMLTGYPTDLRQLASDLEADEAAVTVVVDENPTAAVTRRITEDDRLRISLEPGPVLVVEGTRTALKILTGALRGVADAASQADGQGVARHVHIEYLGEGDTFRAPDSFPLVVSEHPPGDPPT
jgi:hypothetical protein